MQGGVKPPEMEKYMVYSVYWRDKRRNVYHGFIKARSHDEAYDFTMKKVESGCYVTAVYKAQEIEITDESICLNFKKGE